MAEPNVFMIVLLQLNCRVYLATVFIDGNHNSFPVCKSKKISIFLPSTGLSVLTGSLVVFAPMRFLFCCFAWLCAFPAFSQVPPAGHQARPQDHAKWACRSPTHAGRRFHARLAREAAVAFLRGHPDTVWLIESVGLSDGRPVGRVWTRTRVAEYSYDPNSRQFSFADPSFYGHHIGLVQHWDSAALHAERGLLRSPGYGIAGGTRIMTATRMVRRGKRVECNTFSFVEVIYPTRDF